MRSFWYYSCGIKQSIYLISSLVSWRRSWQQSLHWKEIKSWWMNHLILKSVSKIAGINHPLEVPGSLHWLEKGSHVRHHSKQQPFVVTAQSHSSHYQNTHILQRLEGFTQCCQGNRGFFVTASPEGRWDGRTSAETPAGLQLSQRVAH